MLCWWKIICNWAYLKHKELHFLKCWSFLVESVRLHIVHVDEYENPNSYNNQFTVVKEPFILDCRERSVYIGEKSCALPLLTSHLGEGWLTFLFQIFMWLPLSPLNQSDSLKFNKHRDIYNFVCTLCSCHIL